MRMMLIYISIGVNLLYLNKSFLPLTEPKTDPWLTPLTISSVKERKPSYPCWQIIDTARLFEKQKKHSDAIEAYFRAIDCANESFIEKTSLSHILDKLFGLRRLHRNKERDVHIAQKVKMTALEGLAELNLLYLNYNLSSDYFQQALKFSTTHYKPTLELKIGKNYLSMEETKLAVLWLERSYKDAKENQQFVTQAMSLNQLAKTALKESKSAIALDYLKTALKLKPHLPDTVTSIIYKSQALCLLSLMQETKAELALEKALELNQKSFITYSILADFHFQKMDVNKAIQYAERGIQNCPKDQYRKEIFRLFEILVSSHILAGDLKKSLKIQHQLSEQIKLYQAHQQYLITRNFDNLFRQTKYRSEMKKQYEFSINLHKWIVLFLIICLILTFTSMIYRDTKKRITAAKQIKEILFKD